MKRLCSPKKIEYKVRGISHVSGKCDKRTEQCFRLQIERSGFEPLPGSLCCIHGQDTQLTLSLYLCLAYHPVVLLAASCRLKRDY